MAKPIPDKDPADLRAQYKVYLQTCVRQERDPADAVMDLIRRVNIEKPPSPSETADVQQIDALERKLGVTSTTSSSTSAAPPPAVESAPAAAPPVATATVPGPSLGGLKSFGSAASIAGGEVAPATSSLQAPVPVPVPMPAVPPMAPPPFPPPVVPPPVVAAAPVVAPPAASGPASADTSVILREALALLESAPDLSTLSLVERDALLGSLIRALATVNAECSAATAPVDYTPAAPDPYMASVPTPAPAPAPVPVPPPAPQAAPAAVAGVQSGSSYSSLMASAPVPTAPVAAAAQSPRQEREAGKVSRGSTYYVPGMEDMGPAEYRQALQAKLAEIQSR